MFNRIETKKRCQLAAEMLMDAIARKSFKTGDKLPPEREIAQEMGVSRNTLREAIAALQITGVLEARRSQGIFVLNADFNDNITKSMSDIFSNNEDPFMVMDARLAFEPGTAVLAAQNATKKDLEHIHEKVNQIQKALLENNESEYFSADRNFHLIIAQITNNIMIISAINSLLKPMGQTLWRTMKNDLTDKYTIKARIQEHKDILNSIKENDEKKIYLTFTSHLKNSMKRFYL